MKNIIKYWLPVYIIAFLIFYFSSISKPPEPFIVKTPDYLKHFTEYFIFSFFVYRAFKNTKDFNSNHILFTFLFILLFAISEEFFQSFTIGRDPGAFDVFYDSLASLILISFTKLITLI